jgi:hypothetical protein
MSVMNRSGSFLALRRTRNCLRASDRFRVQFPLMEGLAASFLCQSGVHLTLGLCKSVLRIFPGLARGIIGVFNFLDEGLNFSAGSVSLAASSCRKRLVRDFDLITPARFGRTIQFVQSFIGEVRDFAYLALSKKPRKNRPVHRFCHQVFCFFDLCELFHGQKTIPSRLEKVQSPREAVYA